MRESSEKVAAGKVTAGLLEAEGMEAVAKLAVRGGAARDMAAAGMELVAKAAVEMVGPGMVAEVRKVTEEIEAVGKPTHSSSIGHSGTRRQVFGEGCLECSKNRRGRNPRGRCYLRGSSRSGKHWLLMPGRLSTQRPAWKASQSLNFLSLWF